MLLALLACAHKPPVLFPNPAPRVELGDIPAAHGPRPVVLDEGAPAPSVGLLVTSEDWTRLKTRSRLLEVSTDALGLCYEGREFDRARAQQWGDQQHEALVLQRREARTLRAAVVGAFVLGTLAGAGVAVAVSWTYAPR